jgi:hypothetical protein
MRVRVRVRVRVDVGVMRISVRRGISWRIQVSGIEVVLIIHPRRVLTEQRWGLCPTSAQRIVPPLRTRIRMGDVCVRAGGGVPSVVAPVVSDIVVVETDVPVPFVPSESTRSPHRLLEEPVGG